MTTESYIQKTSLYLRENLIEEEENDTNEKIRIESYDEVEEMQCLKVEKLFRQPKSHKNKCLIMYLFNVCFHLLWWLKVYKIKCFDLSFNILISINRVIIFTFKIKIGMNHI